LGSFPSVGRARLNIACATVEGATPIRGGVKRAPERPPRARLTALPQCTIYDGYQPGVLNEVLAAALADPAFIESNMVMDAERPAPGLRQRHGRERDESEEQDPHGLHRPHVLARDADFPVVLEVRRYAG